MYGAIIGDLAGSIYEFNQFEKVSPVKMNKLIEKNAFFSDDTILTIAIADAIINKKNYKEKLKEYANKYMSYKPNFFPYFQKPFSPDFCKWTLGNFVGKSSGNGAMMRISPVGFLFDTEKDVVKNARLATVPSHNTKEAIKCAKVIALIIFYARKGFSKEQIKERLKLKIIKPVLKKFNSTCRETFDLCIYSFFTSKTFKDSIAHALSFGGDTDTNCCIVGSMAEAYYGIDEKIKKQVLSKLPKEFVDVLKQCRP